MTKLPGRKSWKNFVDFWTEEPVDEPVYDPVHLAGVIVLSLVGIGMLYWLLWSLLVCEGGLPAKVVPLLQVIFTKKTLSDFGYQGFPYELGIFEGWIVNLAALVIAGLLLWAGWWLWSEPKRKAKGT